MPNPWIVLSLFFLWNTVLWLVIGWLFAPVVPGGWWAVAAAAIVLFLPAVAVVDSLSGSGYPSAFVRVWVFRPFWYVQLFLPLLVVAALAGMLAGWLAGAPQSWGRAAVLGAGGLAVVLCVWGYVGTRQLVVRHLEFAFAGLPAAMDGMRIVQLSDLHVGPHTSHRHLASVVSAVEAAGADLIVLPGDLVDDYAGDVEPLGRALGGLAAPLGVTAVAGNHDVYAGWPAVRRGMEQLGWEVLVNEAVEIEHEGAAIWVVGVGDPAGRSMGGRGGSDVAPDVDAALGQVPSDAFVVALVHNPVLWPELAAHGVELSLSGHTHYGQLAVPLLDWSLASAFLEHAMGVHQSAGSVLYINPGTNFWGIPFRIGTPPEVTVITLRRGS